MRFAIGWVLNRLVLSNDGKPVPAQQGSLCRLIPKGAKNVVLAKDFLKYLIQPKVLNEYLKTRLGRNMPAIVKNDPWWLDPKYPHRAPYVRQGLFGPTVPTFWTSNPAYAQVQNEHAGRGDLREIPDHANLNPSGPPPVSAMLLPASWAETGRAWRSA